MDYDIQTLVTRITQLNRLPERQVTNVDGEPVTVDNSMLTATIVGACFGMRYRLPETRVPLVNVYFSQHHGAALREVLSRINEMTMLRTEVAYNAAVAIYSDRYKMLHGIDQDLGFLLERLISSQQNAVDDGARISRQVLSNISQNPEERSIFESLYKAARHLGEDLVDPTYRIGGE